MALKETAPSWRTPKKINVDASASTESAPALGCAEGAATNGLPRLLNLVEVAELLRLSPHTIRAMVRKGRLRPVRICRRLLFPVSEINRLLSSSR